MGRGKNPDGDAEFQAKQAARRSKDEQLVGTYALSYLETHLSSQALAAVMIYMDRGMADNALAVIKEELGYD